MITVTNLHNYIDFNKTNIILGKGYAIQKLVSFLEEARKENIISNDFDFLPSPVVHHENYDLNFKGFLWEHKNPILFVQNKEFLETCLNSINVKLSPISIDFNVIQIDLKPIRDEQGNLTHITDEQGNKEVNAELVIKTYSKEEAKKIMIEENIDLRKVSFGGYGEI
jgi:hypothetical protein